MASKRAGAQGFLSFIEEGKNDAPPEVERLGKPISETTVSSLASSSSNVRVPTAKENRKASKSSISKPNIVSRILRTSTVSSVNSVSSPPSTHSIATSPIPEQQLAMGVRSKSYVELEPTKMKMRSPGPSRKTSVTQAIDRSSTTNPQQNSEDETKKKRGNYESTSTPGTLRPRDFASSTAMSKKRSKESSITYNSNANNVGIRPPNGPEWNDQQPSNGNKRHTVHIHLGPEEDVTEQYLKAWAKLQMRDLHQSHSQSNKSPRRQAAAVAELLPSLQEGIPFYRRGLLMVNSSSQTFSNAATQTQASAQPEDPLSSQSIKRTSSYQNLKENTPKQRQSIEMARNVIVRERTKMREVLKNMLGTPTTSNSPQKPTVDRISKSSTVTRNNSWNQLQQLDHKLEAKQKQLEDRGILTSTSPSPASAPEVSSQPLNWTPLFAPKPSYLNSPSGGLHRPFADHRGTIAQASFEDFEKVIRQFSISEEDDELDTENMTRLRCAAPNPIEMLVGGFEPPVPKTTNTQISDFSNGRPANIHATRLQLSKSPIQINFPGNPTAFSAPDQTKNNKIFTAASSAFSPAKHD